MEEWVSLHEFARRRAVALSAVQKAIASGRVTAVRRNEKGRLAGIEVAAATMQWDTNTDPVQAAKNGKILGQASVLGAPAPGAVLTPEPVANAALSGAGAATTTESAPVPEAPLDRDPHGYYEARARREEFQSKQAELDYLQALGVLVSAAEMRRISTRRYRAIRDKLLNIADRLAAVLAAERDPVKVHAALTIEIKRVLSELADDADAESAARAAERVVA